MLLHFETVIGFVPFRQLMIPVFVNPILARRCVIQFLHVMLWFCLKNCFLIVGMFISCCNVFSQHPCNVPVHITHVSTLPAVKTFFNLRVHSVTKRCHTPFSERFLYMDSKVSKYMSRNTLCNPNPKIPYIHLQ